MLLEDFAGKSVPCFARSKKIRDSSATMSAEFTMAFFKVRKVFHFHGVNASSRHMPMGSNPATRTIRKADESERRP